MKKITYFLLGCVIFAPVHSQNKTKKMSDKLQPPVAKIVPKTLEKHGDKRIDNYYWLNERENPEVIDYLNKENEYYQKSTAHTKQLQDELFLEMKGRIKEDDSSVPYLYNGYYYITRFEKGKDYPIYSRKKGSLEAKEEIMNDWWYSYIFGDKQGPSIANKEMQNEQLKAHSYARWIGSKTIYGISRDSLVCLTDTGDFAKGLIRVHMQTIYYNMMVLCLAQRASILKFTAEVANLADLAKIAEEKNLIRNIKEVYKNYIEFINKLYFREVSSQIQGIELYTQTQKLMNIEKEISDLDNEIGELHQYVSLMQDSERNEEAAKLNWLAIFFLPFTVVFGILGANFLEQGNFPGLRSYAPWTWIVYGSLISLFIAAIIYLFNKINKK